MIGGRRARASATLAATAVLISAVVAASEATAAPQPTIGQVKHKIEQLTGKVDRLGQQYDQVQQNLAAARQRLDLLNRQEHRYNQQFHRMREAVAQIAALAYEDGSFGSQVGLLTSGNPQQILNQSSILLELSATNSAQMDAFLAAARQLTGTQRAARRTAKGILALRDSLRSRRAHLNKLLAQQQTLLAELTPVQRQNLGPGGGSGGTKYTGPTSTQAEKAVSFAYAQIGCPYVYAGTGPCNYGYDCSGLTQAAWAYAGVSIPRTSYDQIASLPAVSLQNLPQYLQPGDILGFAGNSHVGIYIGHDELIDAPVPGADVQIVPLSGWYLSNLDAAVRP